MENIDLKELNNEQKKGVLCTEGPLLILAGAGSGKTRVLTYRTCHLIKDMGVKPYNIMAITFTNKAAKEMKSRIRDMIGDTDFLGEVWVSTFHSACVRILRRFASYIGYGNNFTIYDTDDTKKLMKQLFKDMNINNKDLKEKMVLNKISSLKNELIGPEDFANTYSNNPNNKIIQQIYFEYESRLRQSNAMDFDNLIMNTVRLFKQFPDALNVYEERLHYIMVDEYQDTNTAQFELIRLLSNRRRNLCVVGDDDQSIYKFRGANIYNILNFEKYFKDATVIKLEQNYRSTKNILDAANEVIKNNEGRKSKRLWTDIGGGDKIAFRRLESAYDEANYIISDIYRKNIDGTYKYKDDAIIYRTNAQSRILEEKLIQKNIPYKIVGGVNFYSRKEIKDVLAYLHVLSNAKDDIAIKRIINVPSRGIGNVTINKIFDFALENNMSFFDALENVDYISSIRRGKDKIKDFTSLMDELFLLKEEEKVAPIIKAVIDKTGYRMELIKENTEEAKSRIQNLEELVSKGAIFDENRDELENEGDKSEEDDLKEESNALLDFLEEVSLIADIDNLVSNGNFVSLMTIHSAKGLEFDNLYISGMEEGLFPSFMSMQSKEPNEDMEEERRLCYVGITRAKKHLTLTSAEKRMVNGDMIYSTISRFIKEIPAELFDKNYSEQNEKYNSLCRVYDREDPYREGSSYVSSPYGERAYKNSYGGGYERKSYKSSISDSAFDLKKKTSSYGIKIKKTKPDYEVGDIVRHRKFGEGKVISIKDGEKDFLVTVDFNVLGKKKMFASFAKLEKL